MKNFRLSIQSIPHTKEDEARSQALDKIHDSHRKRWRESMVAGDLVQAKAFALEAAKYGNYSFETEVALAYIATARGEYGEVVSLLEEVQFNVSLPLPNVIKARSDLALGRTRQVREFWSWYSGEKELWSVEIEKGLPALNAPKGLASRILLAYAMKASEFPKLALPVFHEVGRDFPTSAAAALGIAWILGDTGHGQEALPFLAIARVYGTGSQLQVAEEGLQRFSPAEREAAMARAKSNPGSAYRL